MCGYHSSSGPGHAVPVTKVQENYWEKEKEQETEEEKQKIESTEDLNGEFHTGPLGKGKTVTLGLSFLSCNDLAFQKLLKKKAIFTFLS